MKLYALLNDDNSQVVKYCNFADNEIPTHKVFMWRLVEDNIPAEYDEFYHILSEPTLTITENAVIRTYQIENKPIQSLQILIKQEAARRILETFPLWKQYNMAVDKFTLMDNKNRTPEEEVKLQEITANIDWIKSVRIRSNEMELMNPIPKDYTNDSYWEID